MYDKFINELEKVACSHDKRGMKYFLNTYLSEDGVTFLKQLLNGDTKKFKTKDWKEILQKAEKDKGLRKMLSINRVPKWVFMKIAPRLENFNNVLMRTDLTDEETDKFLNIIGTDKVKELLVNSPDSFSSNVMSYLVELPDEKLKKYDYLPLRIMVNNTAGFKHNENTYLEMYGSNEDALSEIINNRFITEGTKLKAFSMGCNIEKVINPPKGEIASYIYNILAETIFETDVSHNYDAIENATNKLIELIKTNKIPYACQIDLLERISKEPYRVTDDVIKAIATYSQIDEVLAKVAKTCYSKTQTLVMHNSYAGCESYEFLKSKMHSDTVKKALFLEFLSHRPDGRPLTNAHLKEASEWGDENLNKLIVLDIEGFNLRKVEGKMGEYDFYLQFYKKLKTCLSAPERTKPFVLQYLLCDKQCNKFEIQRNKKTDKFGYGYIAEDKIDSFITKKYRYIGCIHPQEYEGILQVIKESKELAKNDENLTKENKENILETLDEYRNTIDRVWKIEAIRREFPSFFLNTAFNYASDKDRFKFNIFDIVKESDVKIEEFNNFVSKIDDLYTIKSLKAELLESIVNSTKVPDSAFLFIVVEKCNSIYDTLDNKFKELEEEMKAYYQEHPDEFVK